MRLVFFGSGEFGIPTLRLLAGGGHEIALVVSQPDRPAGRGGKTRPTPLKAEAEALGLPVACPEKPGAPEFVAEIGSLRPDLAVVVAYGHLIRRELLDVPRLGFVNLHASILPKYRGAAPVPWAILSGETVSGATVFRLDEKFDTGAILGTVELPIDPLDTSGSYLAKLAEPGAQLMAEVTDALAAGSAAPKLQDNSLARAAPKLKKEDGDIDWSAPFAEIERKVRAFQPWPLASTILHTARGPLRVSVLRLLDTPGAPVAGATKPGHILSTNPSTGLVIMTGDKPARLDTVRPEGKRTMQDDAFLRGVAITGSIAGSDTRP